MHEVLNNWNRLSLTEDEGARVNLESDADEAVKEYILAARFLTRRVLNVEAIGRTFKPLWKARHGFHIRVVGSHTILFVFEVESDAERVLAMEPWTFDKHLVLLQKFDGSCPVRQMQFSKIKFWIQLHGLPVNKLNWKTAMEIGKTVGSVSHSENRGDMIGGDFLRVRVEIDVSKPVLWSQNFT
ncbi:hypothetical protein SO802_010301 [Lithocarpus litseifolius]|uniref:DUF4283 domain-containing protein n=1 Tax=Lithocarpus litseifolius TaxID=425828 RepID=A0AAW2DGW5_9ROSI